MKVPTAVTAFLLMAYGVDTVERIAEAVNRDLNPGSVARVPAAVIPRAQQVPDEQLP